MHKISLTSFIDIIRKAGTQKITKINSVIKQYGNYSPSVDFYKKIRDKIVEFFEGKCSREELIDFHLLQTPSKMSHYSVISKGVVTWAGRKDYTWFTPDRAIWGNPEIQISINPELGLIIDDKKYIIKLYFKSEQIRKTDADIILELMKLSIDSNDIVVGVLDVRNSRLITSTREIDGLDDAIKAELAYIESYWKSYSSK